MSSYLRDYWTVIFGHLCALFRLQNLDVPLWVRLQFCRRKTPQICSKYASPTSPLNMNSLVVLCLLSFSLFSQLSRGEGGPPLITDDPDPPGDGHWEINIALTLNAQTDAQSWELPHLDVNYGLGDSIQLKWESGFDVLAQSGTATQTGWEDSLVGVKWRIVNGGDEGWSVGAYPQVGFRFLSTSNPNVAGPSTYALIPVEVKKGFGRFVVDGEVGVVLATDAPSGWMYGVCAGFEIIKELELLAEVHGQVNGTTGASLLFPPGLVTQVGGRFAFNENIAAIASVGRTFFVPSGELPTTLVYTGVCLTL
jgi:hypothetical protein